MLLMGVVAVFVFIIIVIIIIIIIIIIVVVIIIIINIIIINIYTLFFVGSKSIMKANKSQVTKKKIQIFYVKSYSYSISRGVLRTPSNF